MSDDLDLVGRIRLDSSGVEGGLDGVRGALGKVAAVAAGAFAVNGIKDYISEGIAALNRISQIEGQTAAVIKSTGNAANVTADSISGLAQSIERVTGIEAESVQEGQNLLLTFTNIKNGVGAGNDVFNQATNTLVDMATAMGGDAKSSAVQLGKALNDPVKGISALSKVGVTFTDVQKAQIEGFVAGGDAASAQKVILEELNKEFGGSAAAFGESGAGAMAKLQNELGNVQEAVATGVLPVITVLMDKLQSVLPPIIDGVERGFAALSAGFSGEGMNPDAGGLVGFFQEVGGGARGLVDGITSTIDRVKAIIGEFTNGTDAGAGVGIGRLLGFEEDSAQTGQIIAVIGGIRTAIEAVIAFVREHGPTISAVFRDDILPVVTKVGTFIKDNLLPIIAGIGTVLAGAGVVVIIGAISTAVTAVTAALAVLASPIVLVVAGIALLVAGLIYAYTHFEGFRNVVQTVVEFVIARFNDLVAFGREIFPQLQEAVGHVFNVIKSIIEGVIGGVLTFWRLFGDDLIAIGRGAFDVVRAVIETAINVIANVIRLVLAVINGDWRKAWDALKGIVSAVWEGIGGVVSGALEILGGVIRGAGTLLKEAMKGAWDAVSGVFDAAGEMLRGVGAKIIAGLINGIKDKFGDVKSTLGDLTKNITDWKGPAELDARLLTPAGQSIVNSLIPGFRAAMPAVRAELANITGAIAATPLTAGIAASGSTSPTSSSVTIQVDIHGAGDGDSVRAAIPELTNALRAAVGKAS